MRGVLQQAGRYRKVKLMLVGEANVGKTSLLHCLRGEGRRGTEVREDVKVRRKY